MVSLIVPRRRLLRGLASLAICAPAVVRASSLMAVSARFCGPCLATLPWTASQEALALLQHEMERRLAETLFGPESFSAGADISALARRPMIAEAKMTELWELRTLFGPRGSPPKLLEDLPAEVRAGLSSMLGAEPNTGSERRFPSCAAPGSAEGSI